MTAPVEAKVLTADWIENDLFDHVAVLSTIDDKWKRVECLAEFAVKVKATISHLTNENAEITNDREELRGALSEAEFERDQFRRENAEMKAQVAVLSGEFKRVCYEQCIEGQEADALANLPASAQAFLREKEEAEAEIARLREALPTLEQWERFVEGFLDTTPEGFTDREMANAIVARIDRALSDATTKALEK